MRNLGMKLAISLLIGGLIAAIATPAGAWPVGLDFITGGGFIFTPPPPYSVTSVPGSRANFGWHGGVKNGDWWGNGNYVDHGGAFGQSPFHVHARDVTGYIVVADYPPDKNGHPRGTRDICGNADTNAGGPVQYRVRMRDLREPGRDSDAFGIALFYGGSLIYLNQNFLSGGNIQLHKGNRSNTAPSAPPSCDSLPDPFAFT